MSNGFETGTGATKDMCGRFTLTATPEDVRRFLCHVDQPDFPPRTDIRPTEPIGVVVRREGARRFTLVRWGFVPAWAPDPGAFTLLVNARAETATEKPSFRGAMRHGRCLVPASGFIEWRRDSDGSRHPHYIAPKSGGPIAFAGLTETWAGADGSEIDTAAILTVDANAVVAAIHDRMPAIVAPADFEAWLDTGRVMADAARKLLRPAPDDLLDLAPLEASGRPRKTNKTASQMKSVEVRGESRIGGVNKNEQLNLFRDP